MNLDLRNSDKANLELALTHWDLGWFGAENQGDNKFSTMDRWAVMQSAQNTLQGHDSGLAYLAVVLLKAKQEVTSDSHLSKETQQQILSAFCFWDFLFTNACLQAGVPVADKEKESPVAVENKDDVEIRRSHFVALIDSRLKRLKVFVEYALTREKLERDAEARSLSLPPIDVTDKLLRYEAHLDRQLYRAMDQLERLQRQRRGENVPPPLSINLGKRT